MQLYNFLLVKRSILLIIFSVILLSCGSYQYSGNISDGIYSENKKEFRKVGYVPSQQEPAYDKEIKKHLIQNKNVLISAHGNSLRALCKFLFNISDNKINEFEIPTGNPLLIDFDESLKIRNINYLDKAREKIIIINQ